jgi:hypothetical protein
MSINVAKQGDTRHRSSVAILIETACADHRVEVPCRQRAFEEEMCPRDPRVDVADSGGVLGSLCYALGKVCYVLVLLSLGQVFNCIDELGSPDLGHRDGREWENFEFGPSSVNPGDDAVRKYQHPI